MRSTRNPVIGRWVVCVSPLVADADSWVVRMAEVAQRVWGPQGWPRISVIGGAGTSIRRYLVALLDKPRRASQLVPKRGKGSVA